MYGPRHLRQLVAIKRLQTRGMSLAEIQQKLPGISDARLARIVGATASAAASPDLGPRSEPRRERFWSADHAETPAGATEATQQEKSQPLAAVALPNGVTLLIPSDRLPDDLDIEAIEAAAAPLLKLLKQRRLLRAGTERNSTR